MARPINTQKQSNTTQPEIFEQSILEVPETIEIVEKPIKSQPKVKRVDKMYRLTEGSKGASCMIKVGRNKKLTVFDEKLQKQRAIRHCPNELSIYVDEQSEHAVVEEIVFEKGNLEVSKFKTVTQDFLDIHPSNAEHGGIIFEAVDYAKEADDIVQEEELISKIREAVRIKALEDDGVFYLEMVASVLENSLTAVAGMNINELKRVIYFHINDDPMYFVDGDTLDVNIFDDLGTLRTYTTLKAIQEGIIKRSANGRSILWAKGNKEIIAAPFGMDAVEYFAEFLASNDGILVFAEIEKRLKL